MRRLLFIISICSLFLCVVDASRAEVSDNSDVNSSVEGIIKPLKELLFRTKFQEEFISQTLNIIRINGRNQLSIDQKDVDDIILKAEDQERHQQVQQIIKYDLNFDGKVTADEIKEIIVKRNNADPINEAYIDNQVNQYMQMDLNNDKSISLKEMSTLQDKIKKQYADQNLNFQLLLNLDTKKDKVLTIDELKTIALNAFSIIDTNHDGILSQQEKAILSPQTSMFDSHIQPTFCKLPKPKKDEKVVFLGIYDGQSLSSVSVAGQVGQTEVVQLKIKDGAPKKIYIIASSFTPVIWQLSGKTNQISRIVIGGRSMPAGTTNNDMGNGKINSGVVNISSKKVTFVHARNCGMADAYNLDAEKQDTAKSTIESLLGRKIDFFNSIYSGDVSTKENPVIVSSGEPTSSELFVKTPVGFDDETWARFKKFFPGGLVNLNVKDVISDAPAVDYIVLPNWAGISQLVYKKSFVAGKNGYKIIEDIPYFPAGLYGGMSTNFFLKKGVNLPKGDPGHSCVVYDETHQPATLLSKTLCHK